MPVSFKYIIDALNTPIAHDTALMQVAGASLIGKNFNFIKLNVLGYGLARFGSTLFSEIRNAVFGSVAQSAIRQASKQILEHLFKMDLTFHTARQTGGLIRSMDRGAKGINQVNYFFL